MAHKTLHKAIFADNLEDLESLLCNLSIDINVQDERGRTPLFVSLEEGRSTSFIMRLIRAGCDVKLANKSKITPLHVAISSSSNEIAHELIKRGADINAQDNHVHISGCYEQYGWYEEKWITKQTPLHFAVQHNNLEGVCMLLYFGANIYIMNSEYMTPLLYAVWKNLPDMVKILIRYYDESYYTYATVLNRFHNDPFKLKVSHEGTVLLLCSFRSKNAEVANLFWDNINFENILDNEDSNLLLAIHIKHSRFSTSDWLKFLYLLLNIYFSNRFTIDYKFVFFLNYYDGFFFHLFKAFVERNIQATTRLGIINICLSLGAPIHVTELQEAHERYGFGEELEALVCASNGVQSIWELIRTTFISFILAREEDFSNKLICEVFESYFLIHTDDYFELRTSVDYFIGLLSFFSLPANVKQNIKDLCCDLSRDEQQRIFKKINETPEFPTLLELSRNQARKFVKQTNEIKYPYQFYDAVKKLNVPECIKDLICLKTPPY